MERQNTETWRNSALQRSRSHERRAKHWLSNLICKAYRIRRLRRFCLKLALRLENGQFYSATLRRILQKYHGVEVGDYSYGPVCVPGVLPRGSVIGRYCSVAPGLVVRRRNHPIERPFLHPFFYNSQLGYLERDTIPLDQDNPLQIGHDVWIGERVSILASCKTIGDGAVLAAGSVVTSDVEPYSIVAGVPARKIRMRFDEKAQSALERSQWWLKPFPEVLQSWSPAIDMDAFIASSGENIQQDDSIDGVKAHD